MFYLRALFLTLLVPLILASCAREPEDPTSSGSARAESSTPLQVGSAASLLNFEEVPLKFSLELDDWVYEISIQEIQYLDISVEVDKFPPGFAGLKVDIAGKTVGSVISKNDGRQAPELGLANLFYRWSGAPVFLEQSIPWTLGNENFYVENPNVYFPAGCHFSQESKRVSCRLQESDQSVGLQTFGFYTIGEGLIVGETDTQFRIPSDEATALVNYLNGDALNTLGMQLRNEQGATCLINIVLKSRTVSADRESFCTVTSRAP